MLKDFIEILSCGEQPKDRLCPPDRPGLCQETFDCKAPGAKCDINKNLCVCEDNNYCLQINQTWRHRN